MPESRMQAVCISKQAQSLWAKSDYGVGEAWLPLFVHMYDSAGVARRLWNLWLPTSTKRAISKSLGGDENRARQVAVFLAAVHDIGKATPIFQATPCGHGFNDDEDGLRYKPERAGLAFPSCLDIRRGPRHPVAGQVIFEKHMAEAFGRDRERVNNVRSFASVIGCHHGRPPERAALREARISYPKEMGFEGPDPAAWESVQDELVRFAGAVAGISGADMGLFSEVMLAPQAASLLTGIVIMCDWIASNQDLFELVPLRAYEGSRFVGVQGELQVDALEARAERGWSALGIGPSWSGSPHAEETPKELFESRFTLPPGAVPHPVQTAAFEVARTMAEPGICIIEAPMGEGKTEAALTVAEVLAARFGCGGVAVALPTMATTDAMFSRVYSWLRRLTEGSGADAASMYLAHGKARLNEEYQGIASGSHVGHGAYAPDLDVSSAPEAAFVDDWMRGRKRGMLANFVTCTVDQVLMAALEMKHLPLRHLALANKVVVIDECHAYDAYMQEYLDRALEWLGSWNVPVILLSATLPDGQRQRMVDAYLQGRSGLQGPESPSLQETAVDAYPRITYSDGAYIRARAPAPSGRRSVAELSLMQDGEEALVELLSGLLADGGVAGVVCDTVGRAQRAYEALSTAFADAPVLLAHSRFIDHDRMENESRIREMLGIDATVTNGKRPVKAVVVGTQVLEQSLDIDFDVMVTDVAPVDLVMQRIGRLHRHARDRRPEPLRAPKAYLRGIRSWEDGVPEFDRGVSTVYAKASLMESLAVLGLSSSDATTALHLPEGIASMVRIAYSEESRGLAIPGLWAESYAMAVQKREQALADKRYRAKVCLLQSVNAMNRNKRTLTDWYQLSRGRAELGSSEREESRAERSVRDAQESIEVLLFEKTSEAPRLLAWVGDEAHGVPKGSEVAISSEPPSRVAKVAAQCAVRLPASMSCPDDIDDLIAEIEELDASAVGAWQESLWLSGRLALFLERGPDGNYGTEVHGFSVTYSRTRGLVVDRLR